MTSKEKENLIALLRKRADWELSKQMEAINDSPNGQVTYSEAMHRGAHEVLEWAIQEIKKEA